LHVVERGVGLEDVDEVGGAEGAGEAGGDRRGRRGIGDDGAEGEVDGLGGSRRQRGIGEARAVRGTADGLDGDERGDAVDALVEAVGQALVDGEIDAAVDLDACAVGRIRSKVSKVVGEEEVRRLVMVAVMGTMSPGSRA